MIKQIVGITLIIGGLVIALFFNEYYGDIVPFSGFWFLLGFGVMAGGAYLTIPFLVKKETSENAKFLKELEEFKKRADTLRVDLDKCDLQNTSYHEEVEVEVDHYSNHHDSSNYFRFFQHEVSKRTQLVGQIAVVWETSYQGVPRKFVSPNIPKDETTVRFKMAQAENTTLYIDPEHPENYFLDVGFLEN